MRQLLKGTTDFWVTVRAVIGVVLISTILVLTLVNVLGHNNEISQLRKQGHATHKIVLYLQGQSKNRAKQNQTLAHDLGIVANYAASLQAELVQNHTISDGNFSAICSAIPGCVLPTVTTP